MNIYSFFCERDFEKMQEAVKSKQPFDKRAAVKYGKHTVHLRIDGHTIAEFFRDVWNGNDYLIGFDEHFTGCGDYSGHGFATDEYEIMDSWESFKAWVDRNMVKQYADYETEIYGQTTFF